MIIEPTPRKMAEQCAALMGGNGLTTEQSIQKMEELFLNWNKIVVDLNKQDLPMSLLDGWMATGWTIIVIGKDGIERQYNQGLAKQIVPPLIIPREFLEEPNHNLEVAKAMWRDYSSATGIIVIVGLVVWLIHFIK